MHKYLLFFFFCFATLVEAKPPQIGPKDVKNKVEEILKAHASYKKLNSELIDRIFQNFLEELDPTKTYFLNPEIAKWTQLSPETAEQVLKGFQNADFAIFQELHAIFLKTIKRRNALEQKVTETELPKGVKSEEFKDLAWATTEAALETRLLRIRALQMESASKLSDETKEKFLQRMDKRRLNREQEMSGTSKDEQFKTTLSLVMKATAAALDAHTNYFTPSEANQFMIHVQQRLFGIGAQLRDDLDGLSIVRILENSPASQSKKIKIHDKIIAVNDDPIVGLDIAEAVELIRGEKGTPVRLKILRDTGEDEERRTEMLEIELTRGEVVLDESRLETTLEPYGDGVIARLRLFSFYQDPSSSSASDLRKAIEEIQETHTLKGVVLDLRGNGGGLLTQAVAVSGLFINKGIVCSIKDNMGKIQHLREVDGKPIWEGPLLVVTNRASASAAEIVAQTLQDYGRALVLGDDRSFGKGSFQTFTLDAVQNPKVNPQGEYKVTRGRYYTVSGKSPQLTGVIADIEIPGILSGLDIGEKFSKFPLANDAIEPHFDDDLSDVSPLHRLQLSLMYKHNLQTKLSTYKPYTATLRKNSKLRISSNKNYQNCLAEIAKNNFDSPPVDLFGQSDLQLSEAISVMKDLLFLMNRAQEIRTNI